ncbi:uncharacterized protein LOC122648611 [Telopea speciosissima]|uniref:uncharacterized protein LOC122648611 n=1 Tax=Telopea speciosissima TaxID=54955 RepID=UPI001CC3B3ED|nr:uncharacterized protein LOC122648611 [Telopea speciosissima]
MALSSSSLVFKVRRRVPELITPAKPTPHETKYLSDIDDQECLRCHNPGIQFYRNEPAMREKDPVKVMRKAIADALVFYYPFAGRVREVQDRKLVVDCTGQGVLFIEADADVRLEQFGDSPLLPPFPCLDDLLYDVPGSADVLGCPLMLIQVTRLMCGGFIISHRVNHTICDAIGFVQFMSAVSEMARGAQAPSVPPVWKREFLNATNPHPSGVTFLHREHDEVPHDTTTDDILLDNDHNMVQRDFFFGQSELAALRRKIPPHLRTCSTFDVLTAFLWRCRTIAIQPKPDDEMRMICYINTRSMFQRPPALPVGYYGNVLASPVALSTAANLCQNPLGYALEVLKKAKDEVTEEYMRSLANFLVMKGRPHVTTVRSYMVSDLRHIGFGDLDFGWGKPIYGSIAKGAVEPYPALCSFYIPFKDHKGEDGIMVPVCLPEPAMKRFVTEIESMIKVSSAMWIRNFIWAGEAATSKAITVKWDRLWLGNESVEELLLPKCIPKTLKSSVADFLEEERTLPTVQDLELQGVLDQASSSGITCSNREDKKFWAHTLSGNFTVKSAWEALRSKAATPGWVATIWNRDLHPRTSVFGWRLALDALPTDHNVRRKAIPLPSRCELCHAATKSSQHLFLDCSFSNQVWREILGVFNQPWNGFPSIERLFSWWRRKARLVPLSNAWNSLPIICCHQIWWERNKRRYEGLCRTPKQISKACFQEMADYSRGRGEPIRTAHELAMARALKICIAKPTARNTVEVRWRHPPLGWWKLNIDGSSLGNPGSLGAGGILCDHKRAVLMCFAEYQGVGTNFKAEMGAFFSGIRRACDLKADKLWIECDSEATVKSILSRKFPWFHMQDWWSVSTLLDTIQWRIAHCFRESNSAADSLANFVAKRKASTVWNAPPSFILHKVSWEALEHPYYRFN